MHFVIARAITENIRCTTNKSIMQDGIPRNNSKTEERNEESEGHGAKGINRKQIAILVERSTDIYIFMLKIEILSNPIKGTSCKAGYKARPGYRLLIRYFRQVDNRRIEKTYCENQTILNSSKYTSKRGMLLSR